MHLLCHIVLVVILTNISNQTLRSGHPLSAPLEAYLEQDFLTGDDWEQLIIWQKILVPFRELCEQEEGRTQKLGREGQYGTPWRAFHGINFMHDVRAKAQAEVNELLVDLENTDYYNAIQRS
jgi:hypothetical protein